MIAELPPFNNEEHNFKSASTLVCDITFPSNQLLSHSEPTLYNLVNVWSYLFIYEFEWAESPIGTMHSHCFDTAADQWVVNAVPWYSNYTNFSCSEPVAVPDSLEGYLPESLFCCLLPPARSQSLSLGSSTMIRPEMRRRGLKVTTRSMIR